MRLRGQVGLLQGRLRHSQCSGATWLGMGHYNSSPPKFVNVSWRTEPVEREIGQTSGKKGQVNNGLMQTG